MRDSALTMLLNSVIAIVLVITFLMIFFLVVFHSNRNPKISLLFERVFIIFLLFCAGQIAFTPFTHWNLNYLITPPIRVYIAELQFIIYPCMVLVVASRLRRFVSNQAATAFKQAISREPFMWMLIFMSAISAFWSNTPDISLKAGIVVIGISLVLTYVAASYDWKQLFALIRWTLLLFAFSSIFVHNYGNGEFSGAFFSKNNLGNFMSLSGTLWYLQSEYEPKQRLFCFGVVALSIGMLLLTKSGGGIFLLLVLFPLSVVVHFLKKLRYRTAVVFTTLSTAVALVLSFLMAANLGKVFGGIGKDVTLTGRTPLWGEVWGAIQNNYWLGHGVYSFWQPWRGNENPAVHFEAYRIWQPAQAHEGFLDLWLSLGLIGLSLFVASFVISLIRAIHYVIASPKRTSILPLLFLVYTLMSNTTESQLLGTNFVWMIYVLTSVKLCLAVNK